MAGRETPFWQQWSPWLAKHGYRVVHGFARYQDLAAEMHAADRSITLGGNAIYQKFLKMQQDHGHVALTRQEAWDLQHGGSRQIAADRATPEPIAPPPPPVVTPAAIPPLPPQRMAPPGTMRDVHDLLDLPPRPFEVPVVQRTSAAILTGLMRSVWWSDTHFPSHDPAALGAVRGLIQAVDPEQLIHGGDLLDCYTLSRFSQDPNRKESLQDEIDMARRHLHEVAQLAPNARRYLLEGNHEDRLRRVIWDLPGAASALPKLVAFREAMTWPSLLQLEGVGFQWIGTEEQSRTRLLPKLITKHGTAVRKWSGYSARSEYERYGKGGISGHTHRLGAFYHRDHNGSHVWWESGCTCRLDPEYMSDPDWQQGALVITHTRDGERYTIEPVYIEAGRALWRDRELAA